jgi:hypothetical protein
MWKSSPVPDTFAKRARVLAGGLLFVVLVAVVPHAARADGEIKVGRANTAEARRRFQAGERLFRSGRYAEAAREYDHGYQLARLPGFLINIAHCHVRLGQLADARILYQMYLDQAPGSGRRSEVERAIATIDARLATEKATTPVEIPPLPEPPGVRDRQHKLAIDTIPPYDLASPARQLAPTPPPPAPARRWVWPVLGGVAAGLLTGAAVIFFGQSSSNGVKNGTIGTLSR